MPGAVERELHACQIELITDVRAHRRRGRRRAGGAAGGGDRHRRGPARRGRPPAAPEGQARITDKERYAAIRHLLGDAVADPTGGLHVHIGMPDPETAIRAFNALRRHLPLLQALGANSPFRHGRDTGLASAREVAMRGWPRSGVPRAMRDFEDFCSSSALLARAADVPDYTWFWWKLRPHPRLGTVEVRALTRRPRSTTSRRSSRSPIASRATARPRRPSPTRRPRSSTRAPSAPRASAPRPSCPTAKGG